MPLVVGGIVHQHADRPLHLRHLCNGPLQRLDIGDIAGHEQRRTAIFRLHLRDKISRVRALHKPDPGALRQKAFAQRRADPRSAAGDEHRRALEVGKKWHVHP
ncbi:hypothetical protein P775_27005 [Puniceibacterium antarcticum]|uniref:Uncharacterized protein n=1 Tax=Puniceibacterium antarcticum TaxID=1206336 RepID=A0A2G8QWB7_9RHOB|nr:hypothetical protein P775_27005 [Puniceibacterium antarcticum]